MSDIALSQRDDPKLIKIINLLENNVKKELWNLIQKDEDFKLFSKYKNKLKIDETTRILLLNIVTDKIILPRALVPKYLAISITGPSHHFLPFSLHNSTHVSLRSTKEI